MVTSLGFYFAFLGLLGLERVGELWLSSRNARRAFARGAVETGQRHYRVMTILHSLFLVACVAEPLIWPHAVSTTLAAVALGGALGAQALRYWAIGTLGERWNTRVIVLPGVAPVVRGPYRFVRHPNYVAVVLELFSVPLIHGAWLTAVVFSLANGVLLWVRIRAEEAALGNTYAQAFAATPRFVPGGRS
jgi:methyltransferase